MSGRPQAPAHPSARVGFGIERRELISVDMVTSMTMPEVLVAAVVLLAVVGLGLYLVIRVVGERQVHRDDHPDVGPPQPGGPRADPRDPGPKA